MLDFLVLRWKLGHVIKISDGFRKREARCKKYKRGATINNIKLTYSMKFSICQLLVLDHDYSYWFYNYFTVLFGELAVDSITFWSF